MISYPVDHLSQKQYLKLEINRLEENSTEIPVYNFSHLYTEIYKGTLGGPMWNIQKKNNLLITNETNNDIYDDQGTIINISKDLTIKQLEKAMAPIRKFQHLLTSKQLDLNFAKVKVYEVKFSSKDPVFQTPYKVSTKQREKFKKICDEIINANIIEPSKSSYTPPIFLIPKKQKGEYGFLNSKELYIITNYKISGSKTKNNI
ncbi:hypothetical protein AGLY_008989 [Aphis glycines]|uniref:Reverse transcriptase domain-containing protein n=1 Tax=Aphis glycines TaxID=307491 RepID=A0A6G0TJG0_APHGL|nr:hypothetical protein AGLY_008989 [Aphis glycines]